MSGYLILNTLKTQEKKKKHPEENGGHTIRVSLTDEAEVSKGKAVAVRYYILHQMLPKAKSRSSAWLEHYTDNVGVSSSNLDGTTIEVGSLEKRVGSYEYSGLKTPNSKLILWGISSAG